MTFGTTNIATLTRVTENRSLLLILTIVLLLAAPPILNAASYPPVDVEMSLTQVGKHTYYVQGAAGMATDNAGFVSNAGVVITDEGVVVIDALGTPALASKMLGLIREVTQAPIKHVIVTHYHADHIYGLQVFEDLGAEIIAPLGTYEYLNAESTAERLDERRFSLDPWVNDSTRLIEPDLLVKDDYSFTLGGVTFDINYQGKAHSDGDLSVFVQNDRVLYSGDLIFEGRVPFVGNAKTRNWLDKLNQLKQVKVAALVPGHGAVADNPDEAITLTHDYLLYLRTQLQGAVDDFVPFGEAYRSIDWSRFKHLPAFEAANRTNAYGVYISLEAENFE